MRTFHRKRAPHTLPRPPCCSQLRARARARARSHSVGSRMHGTLVAAHEFPCSLCVAPPLKLLTTHCVHLPPQARPPQTPPPARCCSQLRARARAHGARRHSVGSRMHGTRVAPHEFPSSLWVAPPLGLLITHYVHLPPQARPPHTHPPALLQPAARARARAQALGGQECMRLWSRLITSLALIGLSHH